MQTTRFAVAMVLLGGFLVTLAVPAVADEATRHDPSATSDKYDQHHRERTKVRVRAPYTAVDVDTKRRRVHIRVPYYDRIIRW
jgi:hypothetical protein